MGLRFRKSIKVADGVKVNLGTKSAGVSVGGKYGGVSFNTKTGTSVHASAPGTGLSYSQKIGAKKKSSSSSKSKAKKEGSLKTNLLTAVIVVFAIAFVLYKNWDNISEKLGLNKEQTTTTTTTTTTTNTDTGAVNVTSDGVTYVLNTNTKKVHLQSCQYAGEGENFKTSTASLDSIVANGYEKCKKCLK